MVHKTLLCHLVITIVYVWTFRCAVKGFRSSWYRVHAQCAHMLVTVFVCKCMYHNENIVHLYIACYIFMTYTVDSIYSLLYILHIRSIVVGSALDSALESADSHTDSSTGSSPNRVCMFV